MAGDVRKLAWRACCARPRAATRRPTRTRGARAVRGVIVLAVGAPLARAADVRVANGMYKRGYGAVRISAVAEVGEAIEPPLHYQETFQRRWTTKVLHSEVWHVPPEGLNASVAGAELRLRLPAEGQPVVGLLVADPCFTGRGGMACASEGFGMLERMTRLLNQLLAREDIHYWAILGDNFYDQHGEVSAEFFRGLSGPARSKPLLTVPGNHDFWIAGAPVGGSLDDQLGYGFMQFYGQDTVAATADAPYNFAGNPDASEIAAAENFIFGTHIGDTALFGYSGAHPWSLTEPHALEFCTYAGETPSVRTLLLLGHWSTQDSGCLDGMEVPAVFYRMKQMPGCDRPEVRFLYFEGHMHCNRVVEQTTGPTDAVGFMVGGTGMGQDNCDETGGQVGFTVVQSVPDASGGPDVRVDHFPLVARHGEYFELILMCFARHSLDYCRDRYSIPFRTPPGQSRSPRYAADRVPVEAGASMRQFWEEPPEGAPRPGAWATALQPGAISTSNFAVVVEATLLCVMVASIGLMVQNQVRGLRNVRGSYSRIATSAPADVLVA